MNICSLEVCPNQLSADAWVNDLTTWPNLEWPEIYNYLVNSPGIFILEAMKNSKSLEAHNQFSSGWVRTVTHFKGKHKNVIVVKADVMPSQILNDIPHSAWVALYTGP